MWLPLCRLPIWSALAGAARARLPITRALAAGAGRDGKAVEAGADAAMVSCQGETMLLLPLFNFADANHGALYGQMQDPSSILGLADGGAPGRCPRADPRRGWLTPLRRPAGPRKPDEGGPGPGLAIARDIARSHGGDITLGDSPMGGLRATVRVPV